MQALLAAMQQSSSCSRLLIKEHLQQRTGPRKALRQLRRQMSPQACPWAARRCTGLPGRAAPACAPGPLHRPLHQGLRTRAGALVQLHRMAPLCSRMESTSYRDILAAHPSRCLLCAALTRPWHMTVPLSRMQIFIPG